MQIVYIVEDFAEIGGVERIVSLKANELSTKYGHDVTIVSVYKDERPVLYSLDKSIGFVRLNVPFATKSHRRIATLASRLATLARAASRLNKAVKQLDPDIIFFTTTLGALLLPFCRTKAKRVRVASCASVQSVPAVVLVHEAQRRCRYLPHEGRHARFRRRQERATHTQLH